MTRSQKERARNLIRVDKLVAAVECLTKNNPNWKDANLDEFRKEFESKSPVIINQSSDVESENANIETKELFTCFFPDGSMDKNHVGFNTQKLSKLMWTKWQKH
jgi:hypothetical protein